MTPYLSDELLSALMRYQRPAAPDDETDDYNPDIFSPRPKFGASDMNIPPERLPSLAPPKTPGILSRLQGAVPDMIDSAIAGVGTPNIAYGGATDIAQSLGAGRNAVRTNRAIEAQNEDRARQRRRQDMEAEAELEMRRKQGQAADAARERAQRLPSRYINTGSGPFDTTTGKLVDIAAEQNKAEREDRARRAVSEYKMEPGKPEFVHFVENGKPPDWWGKPPAASKPTKETPEDQSARWRKEASEFYKPGTKEWTHHALYGKPMAEKAAPSISPYQQKTLDSRARKDDEAKQEKRQKELAELEKEEYGDGVKPGLHAIKEAAGEDITDARAAQLKNRDSSGRVGEEAAEKRLKATVADATGRLTAAERRLQAIYRKKGTGGQGQAPAPNASRTDPAGLR